MPKVSDAHRAERRRQILDGARRAFAAHGYEGATVVELERAIGLSRGAIFSYFPSKWELFYALASADQERVGRLWLEEGFESVVRATGEESPDWVGVYFEIMRMLRTDAALRERWLLRNPELHVQVAEHLAQCQRDGIYRSDLELETIGQFLGLVLDGLSVHVGAGYPVDVDGTIELVRSALSPK
jgi:TetR/AcrR family transcriptional regulator, transcriptional repressor of aconitase